MIVSTMSRALCLPEARQAIEFARKRYKLRGDAFLYVLHDSPDSKFHAMTHWAKDILKMPTVEMCVPEFASNYKLSGIIFHEMWHVKEMLDDPTGTVLEWSHHIDPQSAWITRSEEHRAEKAARNCMWMYCGGSIFE